MADHLIIDASRQPTQIRCTVCGAAQDLRFPIPIKELATLEREWAAAHRRCGNRGVRFTPGPIARSNSDPEPTTPKPAIVPKPQFPPPRIIREDWL